MVWHAYEKGKHSKHPSSHKYVVYIDRGEKIKLFPNFCSTTHTLFFSSHFPSMPSPYMGTPRLFQSTCEVSSNTYVSVSSYMCGSSDRTEWCCTYRFSELHSSVWHLFSVFTIPIPLFPLCGFVLFHTLLFNGKSVVCGNNFPSFDIVNM